METHIRPIAIAAVLLSGAATVYAQTTTLPNGLVQNGTVVMMQPIQDYEGAENGISISAERHSALIHVLSPTDHDLFARAFDAADRGDWVAARGLAAQGRDNAGKALVTWRYLLDKNSGATFDEINSFLKANPEWPARDTLYARAEKVLDFNLTPAQIIAWFGSRAPASGIGKVRLGEAMIAVGRMTEGRETIRSAWINWSFEPDQELAIVQRDGTYLTPDADKQRISNLLWRDDNSGARRELSRVGDQAQQIAQARLDGCRASPGCR